MNLRFLKQFLLGFVLLCSPFGCGSLVADDADLVVESEKLVEDRFQARWQALILRKFEDAYQYESLEYREKTDLKSYAGGFSEDLTWKSVKFENIRFEGESQAVITYTMDFVYKTPWGVEFENTARHDEEWFFQDGEWWHNRKSPSLSGGKSK